MCNIVTKIFCKYTYLAGNCIRCSLNKELSGVSIPSLYSIIWFRNFTQSSLPPLAVPNMMPSGKGLPCNSGSAAPTPIRTALPILRNIPAGICSYEGSIASNFYLPVHVIYQDQHHWMFVVERYRYVDEYRTWYQALENIKDEQLPPNPNEFDMILLSSFWYDSKGFKPSVEMGSLKLMPGYISWWKIFKTENTASMAAAAPKVWPVLALVEVNEGTFPNKRIMAVPSTRSLFSVPVPWAFIKSISDAGRSALSKASFIALYGPFPSSEREEAW